jgi:flagellar protein FliS
MDAQNHYRQQSIETASPGQLVSMLYHGAIVAISRAESHLGLSSFELANRELQRAQDIVTELKVTLDFERGGVIARNLSSLYAFCLEGLIAANLTKRTDSLDGVRATLNELASGWDQMLASEILAAPTNGHVNAYRPAAAVG